LRRFIERPNIKAAQTRQFALRLSIRSLYPNGLLRDLKRQAEINILTRQEVTKQSLDAKPPQE